MPVFKDDVSGYAFDSLVSLLQDFIDKFNAHTHSGNGIAPSAGMQMSSGSSDDPITFKL